MFVSEDDGLHPLPVNVGLFYKLTLEYIYLSCDIEWLPRGIKVAKTQMLALTSCFYVMHLERSLAMKKVPVLFLFLLLSVAIPVQGAFALGIVNGDFTSGFNGWSGTISDGVPTPVALPDAPYLTLPGGGALLATDFPNTFYYIIGLSQSINVVHGTTYALNFTYNWQPTDSTQDSFQASLDSSINLLTDPLVQNQDSHAGGTFTPTTDLISLGFFLIDNIGDTPDTLLIKNVTLEEVPPNVVPEPGTALLLGCGMLTLLGGLRTRTLKRS
jgi:hypothetical protein